MRRAVTLAGAILLAAGSASAQPPPLLSPLFSDGGIVQHGRPVMLRGHARPGERVTVTLNGRNRVVRSSRQNGAWRALFSSVAPNAAIAVSVRGQASAPVTAWLTGGDVWLCSGQSNMDLAVGDAADVAGTVAAAQGSRIRLLHVAQRSAPAPRDDLAVLHSWSAPTGDALRRFSSICWHFGEKLQEKTAHPIGLIQASRGGSTIEDWIPADALVAHGFGADVGKLKAYAADPTKARARLHDETEAWAARDDAGVRDNPTWFADPLDDRDWRTITLPAFWEDANVPELRHFDGVVWFRRSFNLTAEDAARFDTLALGVIDERNSVWVNGTLIGETADPSVVRQYPLRKGILQPGSNLIAVRVIDLIGRGGIGGAQAALYVGRGGAGPRVSLSGLWRYRIAGDWSQIAEPPSVPWMAPRGLSTLFNGMVAPLGGGALKGVLWYQGESNADRDGDYAALLRTWARNWRRVFAAPDLPVIVAQLPEYDRGGRWPEVRDAQRRFVNGDRHAAIAIGIGTADDSDLHPADKRRFAGRLAGAAWKLAYRGLHDEASAVAARREGSRIIITFGSHLRRLSTEDGAAPSGFELCTIPDRCAAASALLAGNRVVIEGAREAVTSVRHGWAPSPRINLRDDLGDPVTPFAVAVTRSRR